MFSEEEPSRHPTPARSDTRRLPPRGKGKEKGGKRDGGKGKTKGKTSKNKESKGNGAWKLHAQKFFQRRQEDKARKAALARKGAASPGR